MKKALPPVVFLVASTLGLTLSVSAYMSGAEANRLRLESFADEVVDRITLKIEQHLTLLTATRSLFQAQMGEVSFSEFRTFVSGLQTRGDYSGIQGIGFAALVPVGHEAEVETVLAREYGVTRPVATRTDQEVRAVIAMLEPPDRRNMAALGYDMYSEPTRRAAMLRSVEVNDFVASGKVELMQEIEGPKQAGFLIFVPLSVRPATGEQPLVADMPGLKGFLFAPFRAGDLHEAALARPPRLPIALETYDGEIAPENLLYDSPGATPPGAPAIERNIRIAGHPWTIVVHPTVDYRGSGLQGLAILLGAVSLVMAAAIAASIRSQLNSLAVAEELSRVTGEAVRERDFLLQEMKHRIKNSITRIIAIARQTGHSTGSVEEFIESLTSRLQSMATSQDILTGSKWRSADLRELLSRELHQIFGDGSDVYQLSGPPVMLNEKATQALGLTFHELATNALKYADISEPGNSLSVRWWSSGQDDARTLIVDWQESTSRQPPPEGRKGFGTRLIDACVMGELAGSIERTPGDGGMNVRIAIPFAMLKEGLGDEAAGDGTRG